MATATRAGTAQRVYAWCHYVRWRYGDKFPSFLNTMADWPPSLDDWLHYLQATRERVSSYERLVTSIACVCKVAVEFKTSRGLGACDPRALYSVEHKKMLVFLAREYGRHVQQVAPICHVEARSGPYFVDDQCVTGMLEGAAMGCLLGGRRPRTLTSVRADRM